MKLNLKIKGMHCTSCEMLVKDSLEDEDVVQIVLQPLDLAHVGPS